MQNLNARARRGLCIGIRDSIVIIPRIATRCFLEHSSETASRIRVERAFRSATNARMTKMCKMSVRCGTRKRAKTNLYKLRCNVGQRSGKKNPREIFFCDCICLAAMSLSTAKTAVFQTTIAYHRAGRISLKLKGFAIYIKREWFPPALDIK